MFLHEDSLQKYIGRLNIERKELLILIGGKLIKVGAS